MSNFKKVKLAECRSTGNLRMDGHSQAYYVFFFPKVIHDGEVTLTAKGVFELVTPSEKNEGESVVRSYRMVDPAQERILILDLIKLWCYHKNYNEELNEFTLNAFINDLIKKTREIGIDVMKGEVYG